MLVDRVRETVDREGLLPPGSPVVAGVSGGPDSVALLAVLHELAPERGWRLVAAHLDHALRPGSRADRDSVAEQCHRLGTPLVEERVDWAARGGPPRANVEARAREVRYEFLLRVAGQHGAILAVGHHADDRVETFLAQLLRGAGPRGLSLPRYRREDGLVRPLLDVDRDEIRAFLGERGLAWRQDPTNSDGSNLRARLRDEVVPLLRRENRALARAVGRTAAILAEVDDLLTELAAEAREDLVVRAGAGELVLDGPRGQTYHAMVRATLLRAAVREVGGDPAAVGQEALERVSRGWGAGKLPTVELPGGVRVAAEADHLRISGAALPTLVDRELSIPARVSLPGGSAHLTVVEAEPPGEPAAVSGPRVAWVDAGRIEGRLRVRPRRPGDRYRPLGLDGTAKLQDLLVDRRIPRPWRDSLPIVADGVGIVWVPGFRVDDRSRITDDTKMALRLEVTGAAPWIGSEA